MIRWERENRNGGGIMILVNNKLKYKRVHGLYNCDDKLEMCAIELFLHNVKLLVVSCYRPPDLVIERESWERFSTQFEGRFLVVGDFNAHHSAWGDRVNCRTGNQISKIISENQVGIFNEGAPTFKSRQYGTESNIDLAFVDMSSLGTFDWEVGADRWGVTTIRGILN